MTKIEGYERFKAIETTLTVKNKDIEHFANGGMLSKLVGKFAVQSKRKLTAEPSRIQIFLTVLIIMFAVPVCLLGWPEMKNTNLRFLNRTSYAKFAGLGPYNRGNLVTFLITTGPTHVQAGYYKGQWNPRSMENSTRESHISGYGTMAYHSGDIYEGYWKEGLRHGDGRLITAQGDVCEGIWLEGEFTGWGNCTYANEIRKSGQWSGGKLRGIGQVQDKHIQSLGIFESGAMEGVGLQYANAGAYSVGNWSNNAVIGPSLEYNDGNIFWRKDESSPLHKYWINSTFEQCLKRHFMATGRVSISPNEVEAVTVSVSKPIYLTAVGIASSDSNRNCTVQALQILNGTSTSDPPVYTHGTQITMKYTPYMQFYKIQLDRPVLVPANTRYTVLVKYSPGPTVYIFSSGYEVHEGGVAFIFSKSTYRYNEIGYDNSQGGKLRDFYFAPQA